MRLQHGKTQWRLIPGQRATHDDGCWQIQYVQQICPRVGVRHGFHIGTGAALPEPIFKKPWWIG